MARVKERFCPQCPEKGFATALKLADHLRVSHGMDGDAAYRRALEVDGELHDDDEADEPAPNPRKVERVPSTPPLRRSPRSVTASTDKYRAVLDDLRRKREAIDTAIEAIEALE